MSALSSIYHPASRKWMLGRVENNAARPLTFDEIEAHLSANVETQRKLDAAEARWTALRLWVDVRRESTFGGCCGEEMTRLENAQAEEGGAS